MHFDTFSAVHADMMKKKKKSPRMGNKGMIIIYARGGHRQVPGEGGGGG